MINRIQADLKPAMVAKDTLKVSVLRMAIAAFNNAVIARQGKALGLDDQYDVIKKLVKSRQDSIEQFIIAGQLDRAALEGKEIEILNDYLPKQLNDEELAVAVEAAINQTGATTRKEMGAVMSLLRQAHGATIDNKKASALVTAKLEGVRISDGNGWVDELIPKRDPGSKSLYRCAFVYDNHGTAILEADTLEEIRQDIIDCLHEDPFGRWGRMHVGLGGEVEQLRGPFASIEAFDRFFGIKKPEAMSVTNHSLIGGITDED